MKFVHKETGEILNLNESHSAFSIVNDSPSWEKQEESTKKTPAKKSKETTKK